MFSGVRNKAVSALESPIEMSIDLGNLSVDFIGDTMNSATGVPNSMSALASANAAGPTQGDDTLSGSLSGVTLDGRGGIDTIDYSALKVSVTIDLQKGKASAKGQKTDTLLNFENAIGSSWADQLWGNAIGNRLEGRAGNDSIWGAGGDDTLFGGSGNDVIYGGVGHDDIEGGSGKSTLYGDVGNDSLSGGGTGSSLYGGDGNDVITGSGSAAGDLFGGRGNDLINAGAGDRAFGNAGNDTFSFSAGEKLTIDGGAGIDVVVNVLSGFYSLALASPGTYELITTAPPTPNVEAATQLKNIETLRIVGVASATGTADLEIVTKGSATKLNGQAVAATKGADNHMGGRGNDALFGGLGNDTLTGGAGDDTLAGGAGENVLDGGAGNDVAQIDLRFVDVNINSDGGVLFVGLPEDPAITQVKNVEWIAFADQAVTVKSVNSELDVSSDELGNVIVGNSAAQAIRTGSNRDFIFGGGGRDSLYGGAGDDVLTGGSASSLLEGGSGDDVLSGEGLADTLNGGAGNDKLIALNGGLVRGGSGNDLVAITNFGGSIDGGAGRDSLSASSFTDVFFERSTDGDYKIEVYNIESGFFDNANVYGVEAIQLFDPITFENSWFELLAAGNEFSKVRQVVVGGGSSETLSGGLGEDLLFGSHGNDSLEAGAGDDTLEGGVGTDMLDGGLGFDAATFKRAKAGVVVNLEVGTAVDGGTTDTLISIEAAYGSSLGDILTGSQTHNFLVGWHGNDTLFGGSGNDTLDGGRGSDLVSGGIGNDTFFYGLAPNQNNLSGHDTVNGGAGSDVLAVAFEAAIRGFDIYVGGKLILHVDDKVSQKSIALGAEKSGYLSVAGVRQIDFSGLEKIDWSDAIF